MTKSLKSLLMDCLYFVLFLFIVFLCFNEMETNLVSLSKYLSMFLQMSFQRYGGRPGSWVFNLMAL